MHIIGKIDIEIYRCVTADIQTSDVIITQQQIEHILEANKPNTAFILKHICDNGKNYQLILRLKTSQDPIGYKNSVITFLKVDDKRYNRYLRTKKILYKNE